MQRYCLMPVSVFVLTLLGLVQSASSQSLLTSARRFGSSADACGKAACVQKGSSDCKTSFNRQVLLRRRPFHGATSQELESVCEGNGPCDVTCCKRCGALCRARHRLSHARSTMAARLAKLNTGIRSMFGCYDSDCCEACDCPYCSAAPSCGTCEDAGPWQDVFPPSESSQQQDQLQEQEQEQGQGQGREQLQEQNEDQETPSLRDNPFKDDPVQPLAPPVPSEADRDTSRPLPTGIVTIAQPVSLSQPVSPARFRADSAIPIRQAKQLTKSILDRRDGDLR